MCSCLSIAVIVTSLNCVAARLGEPPRNNSKANIDMPSFQLGSSREMEEYNGTEMDSSLDEALNSTNGTKSQWSPLLTNFTPTSLLSSGVSSSHGYAFTATTTRYGETPASGCGGIDTRELVKGTNYIVVASAQAMQSIYPSDFPCQWDCEENGKKVDRCPYSKCGNGGDGQAIGDCTCKQIGPCWCGSSHPEAPMQGTASMGCFTCGKGRFVRKRPYWNDVDAEAFATDEIHIVVGDVCPYGSNAKWCPAQPGDVNACGMKNHLDFVEYPAEGLDNNFFHFSPAPCSAELQQRFAQLSKCPA